MDTCKAKNILIFMFCCLNLFLLYQLFSPNKVFFRTVIAPEELLRMEHKLNESNYQLGAPLPGTQPRVSFIMVRPLALDHFALKNSFLGSQAVSTFSSRERVIYESESGILEISYKGFFRFTARENHSRGNDDKAKTVLNKNEALTLIDAFIEEKGLQHLKITMDIISEDHPGEYMVTYYQSYMGAPIFSSYLSIQIKRGTVFRVECNWLIPDGVEKDWEMEVIPAERAIFRLLEEIGPAYPQKTITGVTLGFYSMAYDAEQWEIPPVWRISINNEQFYYINAFTGIIEEQKKHHY